MKLRAVLGMSLVLAVAASGAAAPGASASDADNVGTRCGFDAGGFPANNLGVTLLYAQIVIAGGTDVHETTVVCTVQESAIPGEEVLASATATGPAPNTANLALVIPEVISPSMAYVCTTYGWRDAIGSHVVTYVNDELANGVCGTPHVDPGVEGDGTGLLIARSNAGSVTPTGFNFRASVTGASDSGVTDAWGCSISGTDAPDSAVTASGSGVISGCEGGIGDVSGEFTYSRAGDQLVGEGEVTISGGLPAAAKSSMSDAEMEARRRVRVVCRVIWFAGVAFGVVCTITVDIQW
ncbi:MAG TPA: hypothetical protein VNA20_02955 [Frankiaceae bacterium]|nr:hypothetical protein [Frankiaceae bacterium]